MLMPNMLWDHVGPPDQFYARRLLQWPCPMAIFFFRIWHKNVGSLKSNCVFHQKTQGYVFFIYISVNGADIVTRCSPSSCLKRLLAGHDFIIRGVFVFPHFDFHRIFSCSFSGG